MTDPKLMELEQLPLSSNAFSLFGDVVCGDSDSSDFMNGSAFERFLDLAQVDIGDPTLNRVQINIVECKQPQGFPFLLGAMECHPNSSQLFFPLFDHDYLVAVAPAGQGIDRDGVRLFKATANQGVNYHRGVWHMPMLGIAKGDRFLMVERNNMNANCEVIHFDGYQVKIELPSSLKKSKLTLSEDT